MDSQNSTAIHILSMVVHDHTEDMHTLYIFPYQILCHKYDVHVATLYFYMFHIRKLIFTRPSVLRILALTFEFFQIHITTGWQL